MLVKEAVAITGGLSAPSKMPGYAYSLPAKECKIGSALRNIPNSSCSGCYAMKGRYAFPTVQNALYKRLNSLNDDRWTTAMVHLINKQSKDWFRWHDSGDIQSADHLYKIVQVALATPNTKHWLPTREYKIVADYIKQYGNFPDNLNVRLSAHLMNAKPAGGLKLPYSTIHTKDFKYPDAHNCPAPNQGGICGDCRACWNKEVKHVSYAKH